MRYAEIQERAGRDHLDIFGAFHGTADDKLPDGAQALILLGPREPGFWAYFQSTSEYQDGARDPLDRWSEISISGIARDIGGTAVFPFGGPPFQPFISWALRSGRAWQSPAGPLVHDIAGMMVSYRGAIALPYEVDLPGPSASPCLTCTDTPCTRSCPVDALGGDAGYDVATCHAYLDTPGGAECMNQGCIARRACPVSQRYGRLAAQSAFHMGYFHK